MRRAYIRGIDYFIPEHFEENSPHDSITHKIGISKRSITREGEYASDLAIAAANKLFVKEKIDRGSVDMLIYCTQSPDYILPSTACILQHELGLSKNCGAFDINLGCSGYVYGLSIAKSFIESGMVNNILLLTADTYSKYINSKDRNVKILFGDGGSATYIACKDSDVELIGPFVFGTDGSGKDNLIIKAGGLKEPVTIESRIEEEDSFGNVRSRANLYMNGAEIFNFSLREIPPAIHKLIQISGVELDTYDRFVFHQANKYMLETLRRQLKIPLEKFSVHLNQFGNTTSSSIPIALCEDIQQQLIKQNDQLMLVGFGVGYSWAACNIKLQ